MKRNPYFGERCLMVLKIAGWSLTIVLPAMFMVFVQSCEWCVWEFYRRLLYFITDSVGLQVFLGLFIIPPIIVFMLSFIVILPFYRTSEERQYNRDRRMVRKWASEVESLSSFADLSVEYFKVCEAEYYSEQLIENLQNRLQKLENTSQCETEGVRVCNQCGAVLPPHSSICEYCGTSYNVKSDDVTLSILANDAKISEHIAKIQHELALAEGDYKAKNLEKRHLYCEVAEMLDLMATELAGAELGFVWNSHSYLPTRYYGNSIRSNGDRWIDLDVVDGVLDSRIKFVYDTEFVHNKVK